MGRSRKNIKILFADSHGLFRHSVTLTLREMFDRAEVVEAASAAAAVECLAGEAEFDIVLLDTQMMGLQGPAAVQAVVAAANNTPVVVLSGSEEPNDIRAAIGAGARGYIFKSSTTDVLRYGLPLVLSGETYVAVPPGGAARAPASLSFTVRQTEVARLVAQGYSNKEIARRLASNEATVKVHVRDIIRKLGVKNRTQVAIVAARYRLFAD